MKTLVAPLNWGLGHASRCIPLIQRLLKEGHDVVLGGDGDALTLLRQHFPTLPFVELAPLQLHYGKGNRQLCTLLRQLPTVLRWAKAERQRITELQASHHFERIISDNRPFLYIKGVQNCYITHQLQVFAPPFSWLTTAIHRYLMRPFQALWVPDFPDKKHALAGQLSHPGWSDSRIQYILPLSRFADWEISHSITHAKTVAVLSGLEPQRSLLEQELIQRFRNQPDELLIVQGKVQEKQHTKTMHNITLVNYLNDHDMAAQLMQAEHIIMRSGYSSLMDLDALGLLDRAELIPTPGQPEQEYLARLHNNRKA